MKKELTIEKIRDKIDRIITQTYSGVGKEITLEEVDKISDLILGIENKLNKTIIPSKLKTELVTAVHLSRYNFDDETYVSVLKQYINYLIENNIPQ